MGINPFNLRKKIFALRCADTCQQLDEMHPFKYPCCLCRNYVESCQNTQGYFLRFNFENQLNKNSFAVSIYIKYFSQWCLIQTNKAGPPSPEEHIHENELKMAINNCKTFHDKENKLPQLAIFVNYS